MSTATSFWQTIPARSLATFLAGVFSIFCTIGLATDMISMGRQSTLRLVLGTLASGVFPAAYAYLGFRFHNRFWKPSIPLFAVQFSVMFILARFIPLRMLPVPLQQAGITELQNRFAMDGSLIIVGIALGYVCFVFVTSTEARRYAHVQAEILLAAEIHRILVPAIHTTFGNFEFCGRSLPSSEVGGDLIDIFEHDQGWMAYIADVSGHGVAPGVVMAMVKSAARMQLSSAEKSAALLERLNSVLMPIKKPEMYATFAYLACQSDQLEYCTAGHPAIRPSCIILPRRAKYPNSNAQTFQ